MARTEETLIVQRVLPHYRIPLFRALHERYGVRVVTSASPREGSFLNLSDPRDHEWAIPAPFRFPQIGITEWENVPIGWMLAKFKPTAVVAEFNLKMSSSYSLPLYRRTGALKRLAFWSHGWQMGRSLHGWHNRLIQYARLPLFAAADALATYSEEGRQWVKSYLPRKPVVALGNTLDVDALRRIAGESAPRSFGSPQLLCVGRLTGDKRFDRAIEAVRLLRPAFPNIALSIIGDGPERSRLQGLVDDSISSHVHFLGAIYDERRIAPHFVGADLFVIAGSAGLSVNHALAYGVPVAAFARSGAGPLHHPEIEYVVSGQSGILIEPFTTKALADGISQALAKEGLASLRRSLPAFVDRTVNLEIVTENFGQLLQNLRAGF